MEKQKNWFLRHKVLSVILILIVLGVIGSMSKNKGNVSVAPSQNGSQQTREVEKPKEWVKVFSLSSSANKQSEGFNLEGGQQKIIYKVSGGQTVFCAVYVIKEGATLEKDGGIPDVMISNPKSDETMMRKDAGAYYLDVKNANSQCDVEIQELR